MPTQRQIFEALAERLEPQVRDAFLAAVAEIRSSVTLKLLIDRLERGDIAGAIDALQIEREAYGRLDLLIGEAYNSGGIAQADALRIRDPEGGRVLFRFGVRNPEAEEWLRRHSSTLITRIVEDQREAARQHLMAGLARGQNPRQTALDLVGRVSRATNERTGGVLGLTAAQERTVANARSALLSGDVEGMRHYLTLSRRNKRFDPSVMAAIRDGRPISAELVARITGRLSDSYLALRGETIGRTETLNALGKARDDAMRQAIQQGKVDARFVEKIWRHSYAEHPRVQHQAMSGKAVPYLEPFVMPDGTSVRYPHDPDAPGKHTIGCRCRVEYRIDYAAMLAEQRRVVQ
ncbi:phage head morphogenesis protein [Pelagibacterium sp. 26DY04]|uniref:head morphogenesis protein n=1 Tax=Pelagibacterium sp. 26DY04 TaxID=2967130 RepID=UPI002815027C|nr:head morphogenesis protein [Pelagibacterium sp. 26DY04]WMT85569.1 phage head morphogenesis protein [Pelagibacterium sp. 26DY04]